MNRRTFLKALAAVPLAGALVRVIEPATWTPVRIYDIAIDAYHYGIWDGVGRPLRGWMEIIPKAGRFTLDEIGWRPDPMSSRFVVRDGRLKWIGESPDSGLKMRIATGRMPGRA